MQVPATDSARCYFFNFCFKFDFQNHPASVHFAKFKRAWYHLWDSTGWELKPLVHLCRCLCALSQ
jgi:hypothetical protein